MRIELDKGERIVGCIPWPADSRHTLDMVRVIVARYDGSLREHVIEPHHLGVNGVVYDIAILAHKHLFTGAMSRQEQPK